MDTERDEASIGWCFGVSRMSAVLESTGSLLLDSGSDEHLCTSKFADLIPMGPDRSLLQLKDVQQNDLAISGHKTVPLLVGPTGGNKRCKQRPHSELLRCVTISCRWRNWCERASTSLWVLTVAQWRETTGVYRSTSNETACVWKLMCYVRCERQSASCLVEFWISCGTISWSTDDTCACAEHMVNRRRISFPVA